MTPIQAGRLFAIAAGLALLVPHAGRAAVVVRQVDTSAYPTVRVTVVASSSRARPMLTENGNAVAGLERKSLGAAKSVVLAVDRSQSMAGDSLGAAVAAARAFVERKPHADRIAVLALASRATRLTGFSTATIDADTALRTLDVDRKPGTSLYDAVVLGSRVLGEQPPGGRVLIVLTDGHDISSRASLSEAIAAARSARVVVYPIGIESRDFARAPLRRLARATGGRYYGAASPGALAAIYGSIASELHRTWLLSYSTVARPGDAVALRATVVGAGAGEADVRIPGSPVSTSAPARLPPSLYGRLGTLATAAVAALLCLVAAALALLGLRRSWVRARLAPHVGETGSGRPRSGRGIVRTLLATLFRPTERTFGRHRFWRHVQRQLERGDVPLRTVEFLYAMGGAGAATALLTAVAGASPLVVLVALLAGALAPYGFLAFKVRRRMNAFEAQLPDLLVTMAASLKAGHSFKQGLQTAADEGRPPASAEFRRVLTEAGLGRPVEAALNDMAERTGSKNFEFVITAVAIQRQVGGSLAGLFDMVADTVRQRQQAARKIRSLTAMGRMSAYVLLGLPVVVALAITAMNPGYMRPLYHTGPGHMLLGGALVMMAIGAVILRRIVSFRG